MADTYTLRLLYVSGGDLQIDYLYLNSVTATEESSWSTIKNLF